MSDNLEKLKNLTHSLVPLTKLIESNTTNCIEYSMKGGKAFGFSLFRKENKIAVQRVEMPAGATFPKHIHEKEQEWGIIYDGRLELSYRGENKILSAGDYMHFLPGEEHSCRILDHASVIFVTIPAAEGYPNGR